MALLDCSRHHRLYQFRSRTLSCIEMANHSHFLGVQSRTTGQVVPPGSLPPMPMQFRPGAAPPPLQPFVHQQFQQYPPVTPFPHQQQPPVLQNLDFRPSRPAMSAQAQQPHIPNNYRQPYTANIPRFIGGGESWFPSGNQTVHVLNPPHQQSMGRGAMDQIWFSTGNPNINPVTALQPTAATRNQTLQSVSPSRQSKERNCGGNNSEKTLKTDPTEKTSSDWREHTSRAGKKFYSSWEKPLELMTPNEEKTLKPGPTDKTSYWREYTSCNGKKYYYNKKTQLSLWEKPLEMMTLNERADASTNWQEITTLEGRKFYFNKVDKISKWRMPDEVKLARDRANSSSSEGPSMKDVNPCPNNKSSPVQQMAARPIPVANAVETSESPHIQGEAVNVKLVATDLHSGHDSATPIHIVTTDAVTTPARTPDTAVLMEAAPPPANAVHTSEKRQEVEENRSKQKKAQEDFKNMLEESKDLTTPTRWSEVVSVSKNDERFQAVEGVKDHEVLFADYMEEFKKKEQAKSSEEHKRNIVEYLEFLKSCDFIKASSQWRIVQNQLEADERCSRLEKRERLELFQEYVEDLEKEEEGLIKLRMEKQRKMERKNRDEFRKLMEEHVANGTLTSKTVWRDYRVEVQDAPGYLAVSSNTTGFTAKDLFDVAVDDLDKQYAEDKERIEDAVKSEKISLSTCCTIEDFKTSIAKEISSKPINDINLMLVFEELLEREEKEAEERKNLTNYVYEFLHSSKDVSASSKWEDCKPHVEEKFIGEESFFQDIFIKVIAELKEKEKEKERKRKDAKSKKKKERKDREKKEKERRRREKERKERKNRGRRDRYRKEVRDTEKYQDGTYIGGTGSHVVDESRKSKDIKMLKKDGSRSVDENRKSRDEGKRKKDGMGSGGTSSRGVDENRRSRDKKKRKKEGTESGGTGSHRRSKDKKKRKKEGTESDGTGSHGVDENERSRDRKHRKRHRISLDTVSLTNRDDRSKSHILDLKKSKKVKRQSVTSDMDTGSRRKRQRR